MSNNEETYQPKYPVGYRYTVGDSEYVIEKIVGELYYARLSGFIGYICTRVDVFDANHGASKTVSCGIGFPMRTTSRKDDESS
jgi:hypothetical protein